MNANTISPFLRRVLLADAIVSGATGLLFVLGATLLARWLQLPVTLLHIAGFFLLPYSALVAYVATKENAPRWAVWAIIITNALWATDSLVLLASGWVAPNALGIAFVVAQAMVVALFVELQYVGLRQQVRMTA